MFNDTMNTFSPRIGFAWDPTKQGKMSVRGGIGIFYDRPSDQLYNNYYTNTSASSPWDRRIQQHAQQPPAVRSGNDLGSAL